MDYIKELEESLEQLRSKSNRIKEIPDLIENVAKLTDEVDEEKRDLKREFAALIMSINTLKKKRKAEMNFSL